MGVVASLPGSRQYADRVNVLKYVKVNDAWRFAPVVEKNGKIVRDQVKVAGKTEHHAEGKYFIEWYQDGKRRRHSVGDFADVTDAARKKSIELNALKEVLIPPTPKINEEPRRLT